MFRPKIYPPTDVGRGEAWLSSTDADRGSSIVPQFAETEKTPSTGSENESLRHDLLEDKSLPNRRPILGDDASWGGNPILRPLLSSEVTS